MQLKVVRRNDGKFLFVEASGEFVNLLSKVQHVPVGALAMIAGNQNAFANFQHSCSTLPDHLSPISKEHDLYCNDSIDEETLSEMVKGLSISLQTHDMTCEGTNEGPYTCAGGTQAGWNHAVAFRNVGDSFEIAITIPSDYESMLLGILPDDANLSSRLRTANVHTSHGCFLHPSSSAYMYPSNKNESIPNIFNNSNPIAGNELRMRYHHESQTLEYSYQANAHGWHKVQNLGRYSIPEGTPCCPVLLSKTTGQIIVNEIKPFRHHDCESGYKPNFFVTSDLKVIESSGFSSYVELLQSFQVDHMLSLKTSTVTFGTAELKGLVRAIFSGQTNVLEVTLKEQVVSSDTESSVTNTDTQNYDAASNNRSADWASGDY